MKNYQREAFQNGRDGFFKGKEMNNLISGVVKADFFGRSRGWD